MSDDPVPSLLHGDDFEDLFEQAPCGYLSITRDNVIASANRRIVEWTGRSAAELVGMPFGELLSVPARVFYETNVSPLLRLQRFVDEVAMDLAGVISDTLAKLLADREAEKARLEAQIELQPRVEQIPAPPDGADRAVLCQGMSPGRDVGRAGYPQRSCQGGSIA